MGASEVAAGLGNAEGQGLLQIGELILAFVLASLIGLERRFRGKSAGLKTQAIVGTAAALMVQISKYGFFDVLGDGVSLDPSRVAAQILSGVGFIGAGLIITRRGAVRGLTTAAAVWETTGIGMAAGTGLWLLAVVVTALHFVIAFGYPMITRRLPGADTLVDIDVDYRTGGGTLRELLAAATDARWRVIRVSPRDEEDGQVSVALSLRGGGTPDELLARLGGIDGVTGMRLTSEDELD
ncbi:MgtC/SapB family protein [Tomitella gaofuii]|uniref:MgtC/SapB family protein n=1 Tax=Tomitella gaofuii TaxID=2760083 RepID=UPI0015FC3954|nr:MgtC/SapB family protein [Tomitella gaofuii]